MTRGIFIDCSQQERSAKAKYMEIQSSSKAVEGDAPVSGLLLCLCISTDRHAGIRLSGSKALLPSKLRCFIGI